MATVNVSVLSGRLVADPILRDVGDVKVAQMRLAADEYASKDKKRTIFIDVEAWRGQAEFCGKYLKKGSFVIVQGKLRQDTWVNKETGKDNAKILIEASNIQAPKMGGDTSNDEPVADAPDVSSKRVEKPTAASPGRAPRAEDDEPPY